MNIHHVSKATIMRRSDMGWTTMKVVSKCPTVEVSQEGSKAIADELGLKASQVNEVLRLINWEHGFIEEEVTLFHDKDNNLDLEIA